MSSNPPADHGIAVVTGAASGIGRATAEFLAREGHTVMAADIDAAGLASLARDFPATLHPAKVDVADWASVERFAGEVLTAVGTPRFLVCAAGINPPAPTTGGIDEALWDRVVDVNLKGMFAACRAFLPAMAERRGGSVVNLASVSGLVGWGGSSVYCATKGAAIALTRALATEYAPQGIRVNCVCPGAIRTPMVLNNLAAFPDAAERLARTAARHPLGRVGEAEEVAQTIRYLLSDAASFVTGVALPVDGGLTAR